MQKETDPAEGGRFMQARLIRWVVAAVSVAALGAGGVMAATAGTQSTTATVRAVQNGRYGMVLVNSRGLSLYRFMLDHRGISRCSGACAVTWPPLLVSGTAKPTVGGGAIRSLVGTIRRANGTRQVTYAGFPLYRYAGDTGPGMTTGEGLNSFKAKWWLVNTRGLIVTHAMTTPSTTSSGTTTSGGGWG
jgi:predicted lipoprotein with Yx(FWY)xxD motif